MKALNVWTNEIVEVDEIEFPFTPAESVDGIWYAPEYSFEVEGRDVTLNGEIVGIHPGEDDPMIFDEI